MKRMATIKDIATITINNETMRAWTSAVEVITTFFEAMKTALDTIAKAINDFLEAFRTTERSYPGVIGGFPRLGAASTRPLPLIASRHWRQ
jgi:hypothetical protein